jgi:hypothetical protein
MNTLEVTVTTIPVSGAAALYCRYPRQSQAQDTYLQLDLGRGTFRADYNAEIGNAVPEEVWHGRTLRWPLPYTLNADAANDLLRTCEPLAARLLEGAEVVWDGNNHRGRLNPDAQAADAAIRAEISRYEDAANRYGIHAHDAAEWFYGNPAVEDRLRQGLTKEAVYDELQGDGHEETPILDGLQEYIEEQKRAYAP